MSFSSDKTLIIAQRDETAKKTKWNEEIVYKLNFSQDVGPSSNLPLTIPTLTKSELTTLKKTDLKLKKDQPDTKIDIETVEKTLHGTNGKEVASNYPDSINVEKFDGDILKAIRFNRCRVLYSKEPFFNKMQMLTLTPSRGINIKSTNESESKQMEQELNELHSKVKSFGVGAGASLNVFGYDLGGGANFEKKKGREKTNDKINMSFNLNNKQMKLWTCYTKKFAMPPSLENKILNEHAKSQFENEVKDFQTALDFLRKFGSHYLRTTYHLGGYYSEEIDASAKSNSNSSLTGESVVDEINSTASITIGPFAKANLNMSNTNNANETKNASSSSSKSKTSGFKDSSVTFASNSDDFLDKLSKDIYHAIILDSDRDEKINEFNDAQNKREKFEQFFTPIWEYLGNSENERGVFLLKIMTKFIENLFFFRLDFEKNIVTMRDDVNLVRDYVDSLEVYLLKKVREEFETSQINDDYTIDSKLSAIFNAELNENFNLHRNLLKKLDTNHIRFVKKDESIATLLREEPNKKWFNVFYSQSFQATQTQKWNKILDSVINEIKTNPSKYKCAMFDCDWHADKNEFLDKVGKVFINGCTEEVDLSQIQILENESNFSGYNFVVFNLYFKNYCL